MDVRLPDGRIIRNVPEGTTKAQLIAKLQSNGIELPEGMLPETTIAGQAKEFVKGLGGGALNLLESAGVGAANILPEEQEKAVQAAVRSGIGGLRESVAPAPGYEDTVGSKFGQAVGSTLPFFALAPLGPAGIAIGAGLGTAAGSGEATTRAQQAGATPEEESRAAMLGAGVGASEILPVFRFAKGLKQVPEGGLDIVKRAALRGGEEAAQEAAANLAQNAIEQGYNPEQELLEGTGESAGYGGATGAFISAITDLALGRRGSSAGAQETPGQPTEAERRKQNKLAQEQAEAARKEQEAAELQVRMDTARIEKEQQKVQKEQQKSQQQQMLDEIAQNQDANALLLRRNELGREETPQAKQAVAAINKRLREIVNEKIRTPGPQEAGPETPVISPVQQAREAKKVEESVFAQPEPQQMEIRETVGLPERPITTQEVDDGVAEPRIRPRKDKAQLALPFDAPKRPVELYREALIEPSKFDEGLDPAEPVSLADIARAVRVDMEARPGRVNQLFGKTNLPKLMETFVGKTPTEIAAMGQPKGIPLSDIIFGELTKTVSTPEVSDAGTEPTIEPAVDDQQQAPEAGADAGNVPPNRVQRGAPGPVLEQPAAGSVGSGVRDTGDTAGREAVQPSPLGEQDAVQEPSAAQVPARDEPQVGEQVGEEVSGEEPAPQKAQVKVSEGPVSLKVDDFTLQPDGAYDIETDDGRSFNFMMSRNGKDIIVSGVGMTPTVVRSRALAARKIQDFINGVDDTPSSGVVAGVREQAAQVKPAVKVEDKKVKREIEKRVRQETKAPPKPVKRQEDLLAQAEFDADKESLISAIGETRKKDRLVSKDVSALVNRALDAGVLLPNEATSIKRIAITDKAPEEALARFEKTVRAARLDTDVARPRIDDDPDAFLYRKEDGEAPKGVPAAVVQAIADDVRGAAKNSPKITVVQSVDQVPQEVRDFAGDGIAQVRGFYMPGKNEVYVIADNTPDSKDAQITLMHEIVGHYGLRSILGKDYARVMKAAKGNEIVKRMLGDREATDTNVEEVIAELSEGFVDGTAPKPARPLMKRIIEAVRSALRSLGMNLTLTDNEVAGLVADSYAYVFEGKGRDRRPARAEQEVLTRTVTPEEAQADLEEVQEVTGRTEPYYPQERSVIADAKEYWKSGSKVDIFRNAVIDQASSVARKFSDLYSKGYKDTFGNINPMGLYRQAQAAPQLIQGMLRTGGVAFDAQRGQYATTEVEIENPTSSLEPGTKVNANMILEKIGEMANNLGMEAKSAELLVDTTLRGLRYQWMIDRNQEISDQADKAETEGKKRLANDLREKMYLLPENDLRSATREAEIAKRNIEKYEDIRQIRDIMNAVRVHAIRQAGEAGRLSPEQVREWSEGMEYVPFDRVREQDEAQSRRKMTSRGLVAFSDVPSLRGSETREIGNIVNNYFNMLGWMTSQTMRNKAATMVLEDMRLADFARKIKDPKAAENEAAVVRVFEGGESVYYELLDEVDVAAFDSLPVAQGPILNALQKSTRLLRTLVTAMPPFAISQVIQDSQRAAIFSGTKQPFKVMGRTLVNFPTFLMYNALGKKHKLVQELEKIGVVGAYDLNVLNPTEEARIEAGLEKMPKWKSVVRALDKITTTSDLSARAAVYQTILEDTGQDKARAAQTARELINFRRRGTSEIVSWGVAAIPFFNAYIQGMDNIYRSIKGTDAPSALEKNVARAKFFKSMAGAFAIGTAYALLMAGNDEYEEAEDYLKDRAWLLPGGIRIPMPAELGVVFKVLPERIWGYIRREGTEEEQRIATAVTEYFKDSVWNAYSSPNVTPQLARPIVEWITNYSFFTGREIVPGSLKDKEAFLQYGANTSEPARIIGQQLGLSPMKVENFIAGVFGMAGSMAMQFGDAMLTDRGDRPLYKMPLLSTFSYDPIGSKPRTEFYDLAEKINRVKTTFDDLNKTDPDAAFEYLEKKNNMDLYSAAGWREARLQQISRLRALRKFIESDKSLSGEEKRQQLDALRVIEQELNTDVREMAAYLRAN